MSKARVVSLEELGVDAATFNDIYRMGEEDGRADAREETINEFVTLYNQCDRALCPKANTSHEVCCDCIATKMRLPKCDSTN